MLLENKVAIVTGASRGIGRTIAHTFADEGAKLVIVGRSVEALKQVEEELKMKNADVLGINADLTDEKQVDQFIKQTIDKFTNIDILVNNAGTAGPTSPVTQLSVEDWDDVINNNLKSAFLCIRAAVPYMSKNQSGRIINISSVSGKRPLPYRVGYCASKMGIIGLTRTLAAELGEFNITVNAICPGYVDGDRIQQVIRNQSKVREMSEELVDHEFKSASPLHRFVKPEEIAQSAVFLASDSAIGITGEDLNVSSGVVMY